MPGTVQHGFTHFRLELALMAGRTTVPPDGIWARPEPFKNYAFPTLTKKLVNYALSGLSAAPAVYFLRLRFSSRPDVPSRRISSAATSEGVTPHAAHSTKR